MLLLKHLHICLKITRVLFFYTNWPLVQLLRILLYYWWSGAYFGVWVVYVFGAELISGSSQVEVEFADGKSFHLSAEFLRVYSPAADSKIRSVGGEKVISSRPLSVTVSLFELF